MQEATGYHFIQLRRPPRVGTGCRRWPRDRGRPRARSSSPETPVCFLRSIFVPDAETCFQLFRGTPAAVAETLSRAGLAAAEGGVA